MQDNVQKEIESWRSQLRKGSLEMAVLTALRKRARYGLELVDLLDRAKLGMSEGSMYPLLARRRRSDLAPVLRTSGCATKEHYPYGNITEQVWQEI